MSKDSNELSESVPEYLRPGPELDLERMPVGSALEYLHPGPKPGLEPMPVDDYVITIANLMKPEAEKKLGTKFTTYTPHFYILKGGINYCIRVSQCYEPQTKINLFVFLVRLKFRTV